MSPPWSTVALKPLEAAFSYTNESDIDMAFTTGFAAVNQALEESKRRSEAASSGGSFQKFTYISWKPGDKKILRFLTDDIITEDFAEFILTNTGQTMNFLVDPSDPGRLDRYRSPSPGIGWKRDFKSGQLEEPVLRKLSVGIAVLREEVPGPDGKLVLQDVIVDREIKDKDGNVIGTYPSRVFGIVQQSVKNFWHTLAVSCFKRYGTICDRDYEITREGTGFDTAYSIIPLPEDPDLTDPKVVHQFYGYNAPYSPDDPDRFLKCTQGQTLEDWAEYFSGEDRYKFWLTPKDGQPAHTPSGRDEFVAATTHNPDEAQAQQATGTSFSSLKDTLLKNAKPAQ